jgi:hypothetical protein
MIRAGFQGQAASRILGDLDSLASADWIIHCCSMQQQQQQQDRLQQLQQAMGSEQQQDRLRELQQTLSSGQQQVVSNLLHVRALVKASRARMEQQRTHEFLKACSAGNLEHMRTVRSRAACLCCWSWQGWGLVLQLVVAGRQVQVASDGLWVTQGPVRIKPKV